MRIFLLLVFTFLSATAPAQSGKWMIKLNNKLLLATGEENAGANTRKLKSSDWKKNGYLEIQFAENEPNTWKRSFLFNDEADQEIFRADSTLKVKVPLSQLRRLFAGKKEITIYTIVAPLDPGIAVRMRRVHLLTMKLP